MALNTRTGQTAAATGTIISANGTALARNRGRKNGLIQNLSTDKVYVKLGASASDSDFNAILAPGSAADDGFGGSLPLDGYTGVVSVYSAGTVRVIATEQA